MKRRTNFRSTVQHQAIIFIHDQHVSKAVDLEMPHGVHNGEYLRLLQIVRSGNLYVNSHRHCGYTWWSHPRLHPCRRLWRCMPTPSWGFLCATQGKQEPLTTGESSFRIAYGSGTLEGFGSSCVDYVSISRIQGPGITVVKEQSWVGRHRRE